MSKKPLSTFEKEMQNSAFQKKFEKAYENFLLSELIVSLMETNKKSVRQLAKEAGLSPTIIQKLRSGEQTDIKLSNFINIVISCGFKLVLQKDDQEIFL